MNATTAVFAWFEDQVRTWADDLRKRTAETTFPDWTYQEGDLIEADFHDQRDYELGTWGLSHVLVSVHRPSARQEWHHKHVGKDAEDLMDRLAREGS